MSGSETEVKRLTVETTLPRELHDRLANRAQTNERSVAAELRLAIRFYLETTGPKEIEAAA